MTKLNVFLRALVCLLSALPALAVPVAVNDTYTTAEDTVFLPTGTPLIGATFNSGAEGWTYVDDPFPSPYNTNAPNYAAGSADAARGISGTGCLLVDIGRRPPSPRTSSGAFSRTFSLAAGATLEVKFNYRLRAVNTVFSFFQRYADAVFTIDGIRYGGGTNDSLVRLIVPEAEGTQDSDWQQGTFNITLGAGTHTMLLGAYSNSTGNSGHYVESLYDNVTISVPGNGTVLANDTGGVAPVTATKLSDPSEGTLSFQGNGNFTYTPFPNFYGVDSFTYRASDSSGNSNTATVTINVTAVNDAPVGTADNYTTVEDTPLTVNAPGVLINDSDVDNAAGTLTATGGTQPANGTLTGNGNGGFTYTPRLNFTGTDSFTYIVSDGALSSPPVTVNINVTPVPDAPQPVADFYLASAGSALIVNQATQSAGSSVTLITAASETVSGGTALPGDLWKYLDNGTDQGTAWRDILFNDTTWKSGRGELGYGDAANEDRPEYTVIEDNPTPGYNAGDTNRYITSYFRKSFNLEDRRKVSDLEISLLRDDAAVVWLNGQRIYYDTGLDGATYLTLAPSSIANEATHDTFTLPAAAAFLADGDNVIAVEVHQQSTDSSDVSFDLGLTAIERPYAGVLANDVEPEGQAMTAQVVTQPVHGALAFNANGTFTYTPAAGYQGPDSFVYRATDGTLTSPNATVSITVGPAFNQSPVAQADVYTSNEDVPLTANAAQGVLANDTDPESSPMTAVLVSAPANGTLSLAPNGSFLFTPAANWNGSTSFIYRASDGLKQSVNTTVTLNVTAVPDVPAAVADLYRTTIGTALVVTDTAPGGTNPITLITAAPETTGGVALPGDLWKYLDNGTDQGVAWRDVSFDDATWREGAGELGYGDVSDNRPEVTVIEDDASPGYTSSNSRYATSYFRKSFAVADRNRVTGLAISLLRDDGAAIYLNGNLIHIDSNLAAANPLTYLTFADSTGNEATHDSYSLPNAAQFLQDGVNILAAEVHQNTPSSSDVSFDLGLTGIEAGYAGVLYNDSDAEGNSFTASVFAQPAHGTLSLAANGTFVYTPAAGFSGTDTFTYRATDATGPSAPATVSIIVSSGPNQKPTAVTDTYIVVEDVTHQRPAATGVLANDSDPEGDTMTAVLVSTAANGTLTLNADGSFTYLSAANYNGPDSFTYRARDSGNLLSNTVTVNLTVAPSNDAPSAAADTFGTDPGVMLSVPVSQSILNNDTDMDGDTLTAQIISLPASGTLILNANGSFDYTPAATGTFTFTYSAYDGTVASSPVAVTIIVNGVPVANSDTYTIVEDGALSPAAPGVLSNDTDPEGSTLTATVATVPLHGTVNLSANGAFNYTPVANYAGSDSFTYTISDGSRTSSPATVSLTVTAVNDAPVAVADAYSVLKESSLTVAAASGVLKNDTDVEGSPLTAALVSTTANGSLTLNGDGSFIYTPVTGFLGVDTFTYRSSDSVLQSSVTSVTLSITDVADTVLISEIMFNPPNGLATQEFIELLNFGTFAVDLGGWEFTAGINFTFPSPTIIAAGGRLVIPADRAAFDARWPGVSNRLATGWNASLSGLSNSGETIRLQRPDVSQPGQMIEVDQVDYSDEGDWATRQVETVGGNTGWRWNNGADGGGMSLQLRNILLSNNRGQNWQPATPTPGAANTATASIDLPPLIRDVKHSPAFPSATQQVHITCDLEDEALTGHTATAYWRLAVASPAAFTAVPMLDDGLHNDNAPNDGKWGATLPAQAAGSIIEFYVEASDGDLLRTWPAPALNAAGSALLPQASSANCFYMVDTEVWTGSQPLYRLIMSQPEGDAFVATGYDKSESSDTDKNLTVIFAQGADTSIRYQAGVRYRGAGSRSSYRPHNWKLNLPHDSTWSGWTNLNLNSLSAHTLVLGSRLMQAAGLACELGTPAAVRMNGSNRMTTGSPSSIAVYGLYSHQTPMGSEWAQQAFPTDSSGNLYKKGRGSNMGWSLHESSPGVPNIGGYQSAAWFKETNVTENDWTDLNDFIRTIRQATSNTTTPPSFNYALGSTVADLEQWTRWWAFCVIINHRETNLSCGVDDDYSIYIRKADRKVMLLQHDFDTILNAGDTGTSANATIWQGYDPGFLSEKSWASAGLDIPQALFYNNTFCRRFKFHLRDLLSTVFIQPNFDAMVDSTLGASGWVPQSERDRIKTFMNSRRAYITTQLPATFSAATSLTVTGGLPTTTSANDTGLSGTMDGATTDRILINGVAAGLNNHDNTWNTTGIAAGLTPGVNSVLVQALDEPGNVLASQTITILYDDGATTAKSGTLAASENWSAAGGPYAITAPLTVPSGVTLTIAPGTSVYLSPAAGITVQGGGRLTADGTPDRLIRFTRPPGTAGTWNSILLDGTSGSSISNAVIEFNDSTAIQLQEGGNATLDRITFLNNTRACLRLDDSYFTVSNCTFPAMAAGSSFTPVGGGGINAGGQGIIRDCTFGAVSGNNDVIRFSSANRPGPALHLLNNTFNGSADDIIELSSADAWIEGNAFLHVHRNGALDSAAAVATADTGSGKCEVTVIRNLFYDCDNAVTVKQGCSAALLYNTIARITKTGGTETQSGVLNLADTTNGSLTGANAMLTGNVITDVESLTRQYYAASSSVTFNNNVLPVAWTGPGSGNTVATDALLNTALIPTPATATAAQVRAALVPQSCSPAIATGFGGNGRGASFPAGIAASGLPPATTALPTATLTMGPSGSFPSPVWNFGYTQYRWSTNGTTWSADTAIATPLSLTGLTSGIQTIHLLGKDDSGVWQTVPTVVTWNVDTTLPTVVLSEILASNITAYPLGATRPDVIELHNYGTSAVSLAGFGLTDDAAEPYKFPFPVVTSIPAGGYLLLMADSLLSQAGEMHINFGLDAGGETLSLFAPGGVLADQVTFGPQIPDRSIARTGPRLSWSLATFTPDAANTAWCDFGPPSGLRLNEWLAANDFIVEGDFLELYNSSTKPVDMSGMMLTDNFASLAALLALGDSSVHVISPLSFIAPSGFVRFLADGEPDKGGDHLSFKLSQFHENLALADAAGGRVDHAVLSSAREDISEGRTTDGGLATGFFTVPTPGFSNTADLSAAASLRNALRITELMYNPTSSAQAEFIELRNTGATTLDLTGVSFTAGITFTFPALNLAPGAYTVITSDLARFNANFPAITPAGVYSGRLDNSGEQVRFEIAGYPVGILDFSFSDAWYPLTDGQGASLQIVSDTSLPGTWGDRESWQAGAPSPGAATAFGILAGPDKHVTFPASAILDGTLFTGTFAPGTITVAWTKVSGPGTVNFTAPANPDTNVSFSAPGVYELKVTATAPGPVTVQDFITVAAEESYDAWVLRVLPGYPASDRLRTADPDLDGLNNLGEYLFGTIPDVSDAASATTLTVVSSHLVLEYRRSLAVDSTIQVIPQITSDLGTWEEGPASISQLLQSTTGGIETWQARDAQPITPGLRRFLRLKIVSP